MGKLLHMPQPDTLLHYALNDIELRGAEQLYSRAAHHLNATHYHGNNQWDSAADAEAFIKLSAFATELGNVRIAEAAL